MSKSVHLPEQKVLQHEKAEGMLYDFELAAKQSNVHKPFLQLALFDNGIALFPYANPSAVLSEQLCSQFHRAVRTRQASETHALVSRCKMKKITIYHIWN